MRKLALALTGLFVIALGAPAIAQTGATAKVTSPNDGQVLSGSVGVGGNGSAAAGVNSIKLFVADRLVASAEPSNVRQDVSVDYNWDTTSAFAGGIAANGWYQVRVEVTATGGATDSSRINVRVDNAPQTPVSFNGYVKDEVVSLSWDANPEPDIIGYRIEVDSGGSWIVATEVTGTSYATVLDPGTYQFRVSALRASPIARDGHASAPTEVTTLTIQAPAESGARSVGNGGGRGATGGGDPRIYGRDGAASTRDVRNTARAFSSGGLSFGGISLPGQAGLPTLPGAAFEWGTYQERLPYSLPQGGISLDAAPPRLAAFSTTRIIPMDALRWVGAGVLMIVIALMLQFIGWRAGTIDKLGSEGAASLKLSVPNVALPRVRLPKVPLQRLGLPTVNFEDAHVRLRRSQDRVRAAWKKARGS